MKNCAEIPPLPWPAMRASVRARISRSESIEQFQSPSVSRGVRPLARLELNIKAKPTTAQPPSAVVPLFPPIQVVKQKEPRSDLRTAGT
jgi:hypothetical protein